MTDIYNLRSKISHTQLDEFNLDEDENKEDQKLILTKIKELFISLTDQYRQLKSTSKLELDLVKDDKEKVETLNYNYNLLFKELVSEIKLIKSRFGVTLDGLGTDIILPSSQSSPELKASALELEEDNNKV